MKLPTAIVVIVALIFGLLVLLVIQPNNSNIDKVVGGFAIFCGFFLKNSIEESNDKPLKDITANSSADKFLEETRKRIIKAYLPIIIMTRINEATITSPIDIISLVKKRYNIKMSPGTVYPILYKLEREGKIKRPLNRRNTLYLLTSEGKETIVLLHQENIVNLGRLITN